MILDKEEHRQFLLEMIKQASIPGALIELAYEVVSVLRQAKVTAPPTRT